MSEWIKTASGDLIPTENIERIQRRMTTIADVVWGERGTYEVVTKSGRRHEVSELPSAKTIVPNTNPAVELVAVQVFGDEGELSTKVIRKPVAAWVVQGLGANQTAVPVAPWSRKELNQRLLSAMVVALNPDPGFSSGWIEGVVYGATSEVWDEKGNYYDSVEAFAAEVLRRYRENELITEQGEE